MKQFWNNTKAWMKKNKITVIIGFIIFLFLSQLLLSVLNSQEPKKLEYTAFTKMIEEKKVKSVNINLTSSMFTFKDNDDITHKTDNPKRQNFKDELLTKGIEVNEIDPASGRIAQNMISSIVNIVIWIAVFMFIMQYMQKRMGKSKIQEFDFKEDEKTSSKSNVKNDGKSIGKSKRTTFKQIAGHNEAKEDMKFLVDFLKNPKKYTDMGAKLPTGAIFYGPPGTGKTLFAKAVAGEAGVPFFAVSGSDFVEKYVGEGASRVRDMFALARKKAPCIIFIDEIDALGGSRDRESHSEQRQTLNAVLKEMDGFDSNEGIIVIGATNRLEDLDTAFIRPGRFDKHIAIDLPDQKSRLEILKIHSSNKHLGSDVNLEELSKMTVGLSGASLEAILNEAAILATTRNRKEISYSDIDDAYFKTIMQGHKKTDGDKRQEDEIRLVSWHEAGHALVAKLLTDKEVPKVTIIPSTSGAGGVAFIVPKKMGLYSKEELINDIKISYAGRAAEYLLLGSEMKVTTGASSDIESATKKIKMMITQVGMSETFGMLNLNDLKSDNDAIMEEAVKLSKQLYKETVRLLFEHKETLEAIAEALTEKESLNEEELMEIINYSKIDHQV